MKYALTALARRGARGIDGGSFFLKKKKKKKKRVVIVLQFLYIFGFWLAEMEEEDVVCRM
jgi:hypothetical protein